jgi:outer membrane protein insertion porin family
VKRQELLALQSSNALLFRCHPIDTAAMRPTPPILTFLLLSVAVWPQTNPGVEKQSPYEGQNVRSVEIAANPRVNPDQYLPLIVQKPGEPYSEKNIQASIQALEGTQAFAKVEANVETDPAGLKLTFVLEPAYYIGLISFPRAMKRFSYARLLQTVDLPDQTIYQESQGPKAEAALEKLFEDDGYFQSKVWTEVQKDSQNQLANFIFHVELGKHARVGKVEIAGPPESEVRRLQGAIRSLRARFTGGLLKPGQSYNPTRIKSAVARIRRELGNQQHPANTVKVNPPTYHPETNRADISISVDTGPEVQIRVVGAKLSWMPFLSRRRQRRLIPIYEENSVDPDLVTEGQRNLTNFFQRKGYFDVKVHTDFQQENGKVLLVYQIETGRKHSVAEISFRGNHHIDTADLKDMVTIKRRRFLMSRGRFSQELLRESANGIEGLYKENGFEQVKVTPDVVDREPNLYITFNIAEGDRTVVSSLKVEGNKSIPLDQLRPEKGFALKEGKPFSPGSLADDRNNLAARYLDRGYLNSEIKTVVSPHPDDPHAVNITYQITEGQQIRVSKVLYLGQNRTKTDLVRISTNLGPEEPLSQGKLLQAESKLYDLGIFDWASVGPRRQITVQSQEQALVKMHEAKRNTITYGFGMEISRRGGNTPAGTVAVPGLPIINTHGASVFPSEQTFVSPRGTIEFTRRNMRGEAETGTVSLLLARLDQRFQLTYTDPHFRRSTWQTLTSASLERNSENPLFVSEVEQASLQFQRYLNRRNTLQLQLRYDFNHTLLTDLLVPELVLPPDRNVKLSFPSGTIIHDTRDKPLDAHHGIFQTLDLQIVPTAFGSSANFARLFTQNAYYKPLPGGLVFANSIRLGFAKRFSNSFVPTSERFFAGGGNSLRGFPINEAGPIRYVPFCAPGQTTGCPLVPVPIGGNMLFILNSELRYPLPLISNLGGVVFYDGGNVYRAINFNDFTRNYTNTVGIGLRYATPIGPVRIDFGHNLNPQVGIGANQFFITLGQAF